MHCYKVTAQSYTTSQRIVNIVNAYSEAEVIRNVSDELEFMLQFDGDSFYIVDVKIAH